MATFGYTDIGANSLGCGGWGSRYFKYSLSENGIVRSISVYTLQGSVNVKVALYADVAGVPNGLLGQSAVVVSVANDWIVCPLVTPYAALAGNYWLAFMPATTCNLRFDYAAMSSGYDNSLCIYPNFHNVPAYVSLDGYKASIYATYTPSAAYPLIGKPLIAPIIVGRPKIR